MFSLTSKLLRLTWSAKIIILFGVASIYDDCTASAFCKQRTVQIRYLNAHGPIRGRPWSGARELNRKWLGIMSVMSMTIIEPERKL